MGWVNGAKGGNCTRVSHRIPNPDRRVIAVRTVGPFCSACCHPPEMCRYHWKRVAIRVALASTIAASFALSIHFPRFAWPPIICNGGFTDGVGLPDLLQ